MLNILIVNIAIAFAFSFIVFKLIIPNIPENFKKKVNENLDSFIFTIIIMGGIFLFLFLPLVFAMFQKYLFAEVNAYTAGQLTHSLTSK